MRLPGLGADDAFIDDGLLVDKSGAGKFGFAAHVLVAGHAFAGGEPGGGQHLYAVADGEYPLACAVEGTQDVEQRFVIAQILGRPSAQQKDRGVVLDANLIEGEIGFQAIPAAFDVGVPAGLEIVHDQVQPAAGRGSHGGLPSFFLETVDGVKGLVGFAAVAGDDEDFRHASNLTLLPRRLPQKRLLQSPRHCVILSDSMDIITGNVGWIEVICGPMFSGKSEELIRRLRRAMIARKRVEVFKPIIDNRYSDNEIVSHGDLRMHSQVVTSAAEITEHLDWRSEVIGIDEANFMGPQLVDVAQRLADSGKQVIISGLDTDYLGRPFAPIPDLLAHAESITKTLAICVRCGNPAKHTQRLRGSDDLIVVGASDMYEARCRRCFEPGIPKQTELDFVKAKRQQEKS